MQRSAVRWVLVAIEAVMGVFAIQAGYTMITGAWDLPMEWLQHTPFTSWVLPGIALMVFVGVGELVAAGALAFRLPRAAELSVAAGVGLVAWILVQLLWMRVVHPVMHPVIGGAGLLIALLALRLQRSRHPSGDGSADLPAVGGEPVDDELAWGRRGGQRSVGAREGVDAEH